jgi:hypothetical protein
MEVIMANYIAVFNNLKNFCKDFMDLIKSHQIFIYSIEYINLNQVLKQIENIDDIKTDCIQDYFLIFSSKEFNLQQDSFYSDKNCIHIIEINGGRCFDVDVEQIKMRIVAKKPDVNIKKFFNQLQKLLKEDNTYGLGVEPGNNRIYSKQTYYKKEFVKGKKMWFNYSLQIGPTQIL